MFADRADDLSLTNSLCDSGRSVANRSGCASNQYSFTWLQRCRLDHRPPGSQIRDANSGSLLKREGFRFRFHCRRRHFDKISMTSVSTETETPARAKYFGPFGILRGTSDNYTGEIAAGNPGNCGLFHSAQHVFCIAGIQGGCFDLNQDRSWARRRFAHLLYFEVVQRTRSIKSQRLHYPPWTGGIRAITSSGRTM